MDLYIDSLAWQATYLTAPNMAAKVNNVVMAIVIRPGMDSGGKKRESQATMTKRPLGR